MNADITCVFPIGKGLELTRAEIEALHVPTSRDVTVYAFRKVKDAVIDAAIDQIMDKLFSDIDTNPPKGKYATGGFWKGMKDHPKSARVGDNAPEAVKRH